MNNTIEKEPEEENEGTNVQFVGLKLTSGETIVGMKLVFEDENEEPDDEEMWINPTITIVDPFCYITKLNENNDQITILDRWIHHSHNNCVEIFPHQVIATFTPTDKMLNGYLNTVKFVEEKEKQRDENNDPENDYENSEITHQQRTIH